MQPRHQLRSQFPTPATLSSCARRSTNEKAEFSRELTTAVIWLNDQGLDIRCTRLKPYRLDDRLLLDVQQVLPLPEAAEYQVQAREKTVERRRSRSGRADHGRFDLRIGDEVHHNLPKRHLIFRIVRAAIDVGATPEQIAAFLPSGRSRFLAVEGSCSSDEFLKKITELRTPRGHEYSPRHYFTEDEELIRWDRQTLAFSNQWGRGTIEAANRLVEAFPQLEISFSETEQPQSASQA